jgi:predicted NAD/FAD-binding protein
VRTILGEDAFFDRVILACHADEALSLLADPTERERTLLSAFQYQANPTIIHTDESVMPQKRLAWSSWNYRIEPDGSGSTHYWMNELQALKANKNYIVSLNATNVAPERILKKISYTHPIFSLDAVRAQDELPMLNRAGDESGRYYCGSYFKYGFHEDALRSSATLCEQLVPGVTG